MTPNMGSTDRKVRAYAVAPLLVVAAILARETTWLTVVLLVLALVMWATSAVSFCPLYAPFRLSTRRK